MATIQLGTTGSASKLCNYAEKRAVVKDGHNVDADYAKSQMKQTRELFSKNDGVQAHHVIQSFQPDEVTPEKANQIGLELAEKLAPGHEVAVYTHDDTNHVHNHFVINSVNFETGKKYQAHGNEAIEHARSLSDEVCQEHDLSIVKEHNASARYTLAEKQLLDKDKISWKEQMREAIDNSRDSSTNFDSFKKHLERNYGIETKLRGNTLSFKHPDRQRFTRANKLGADYEKEGLENGFARQIGRKQEHERTVSGNEGIKRDNDSLHQSSHGRGQEEREHGLRAIKSDTREIEQGHGQYGIDFEQARNAVKAKRRQSAKDIDRWTRANSKEQQQNDSSAERDTRGQQRPNARDEQRDQVKHRQHEKQSKQRRQKSKARDDGLSL